MSHTLFTPTEAWDLARLPAAYLQIKRLPSSGPDSGKAISLKSIQPLPDSSIQTRLKTRSSVMSPNAYVIEAILAHAGRLPDTDVSLINVASQDSDVSWTLSELVFPDKSSVLIEHKLNCATFVESLSGVCISHPAGRFTAIPPIPNKKNGNAVNLLPAYLVLIQSARKLFPDFDRQFEIAIANAQTQNLSEAVSKENAAHLVNLSDAFYRIIKLGAIKAEIPGGNMNILGKANLKNGVYDDSEVVFGHPLAFGNDSTSQKTRDPKTFGKAKEEFEKYHTREWSAEEQLLIPQFPNNYPISPEVLKIARRYIQTRNSGAPMVNFLWRGITSYGKSTGVKQMAALLNMPLVRMTCSSTMNTQDFLSEFVPDNGAAVIGTIPTVEQMYLDPDGSYEIMTGDYKEGATSEDCLRELTQRAARSSGSPRFKLVESNYVKALSRGWIVEVQEMGRVRDPGVMVGLNEYNEPGAVIPLADGGYVRRHPEALCIYTDNVGYASSRAVDQSVIRRMALIIDSYEMPKATVLARVKYNTGMKDKELLEKMYRVWSKLVEYCKTHDINEGSLSVSELENWAMCVNLDHGENLYQNCVDCVISKITCDIDTQKEIKTGVLDTMIA